MGRPLHKFAGYFTDIGLFDNLNSFEDLEKRIEKLTINNLHIDKSKRTKDQTKGDAFEVFTEAYLNTSNTFNIQSIYPELKAPIEVLNKIGIKPIDRGADGIYNNSDNKVSTYQAKYRSNNSSITWSKLSTFIGVSERAFKRHLITNTTNISDEFLSKKRIVVTGRAQLLKLSKNDFKAIEQWLKQKIVQKKFVRKDEYQKIARDKFINEFKKSNRATVIMACGAGKTLVGLWGFEKMWKIESLKPKLTVVFVPSIGLVKQIRADWLEQTIFNKKGQIRTLQICSSQDRSSRDDEIQINQQDLDFEITTNINKIKKWINKNTRIPNVIFCTYQSSPSLAKALGKGKSIDFAIFDEAHRTARVTYTGNKSEIPSFSLALDDKNLKIKKRLFMTATRRISQKNKFYKEGDFKTYLTMDNEEIYGKVCENLTFSQAAKQKIIAKLKIIISYVTSEDLSREERSKSSTIIKGKEVSTDQIATQIAIKNAVKKYNIKKIFSFHNTVSRAKSFTSSNSEGIKNHLPNFYTNYINGEMRTKIREINLDEFKRYEYSILSNARCLIEGVDVPSVNMVTFTDPKQSQIDIVQATGRALRNRNQKDKRFGYILLPIFVEKKKNEKLSDALDKTNYSKIASVINAIKEYDDELAQIISEVHTSEKRSIGYRNKALKKFESRVEGIHPIINKKTLLNKIKTQIIDSLKTHWDEMIAELVSYKDKFKTTEVTNDHKKLYDWVVSVRARKRNNTLNLYQIDQLEKLGFKWYPKGVTLFNTDGLITFNQLRLKFKISSRYLHKLIKQKKIKTKGVGVSKSGTSMFFENISQQDFMKSIGISILDTSNFYNKQNIIDKTGYSEKIIEKFIKNKKIKFIGYGLTQSGVREFYKKVNKKQIDKLLGVTLTNTKNLYTVKGLRNSLFNRYKKLSKTYGIEIIKKLIKNNKIKPVGKAMKPKLIPFYKFISLKKYKKLMKIDIIDTSKYQRLKTLADRTNVSPEFLRGLIKKKKLKPVGWGIMKGTGRTKLFKSYKNKREIYRLVIPKGNIILNNNKYYYFSQIRKEYKKKYKKTIQNKKLRKLLKERKINFVGKGITNAGVTEMYNKNIIDKLA